MTRTYDLLNIFGFVIIVSWMQEKIIKQEIYLEKGNSFFRKYAV